MPSHGREESDSGKPKEQKQKNKQVKQHQNAGKAPRQPNTSAKLQGARPGPSAEGMRLNQWLQMGLQHHRQGQLVEAEKYYRQILFHDQHHIDAKQLLADIALHGGFIEPAIYLLRQVIEGDPHRASAHGKLAEIFARVGRDDEAIAAYQRAIELEPALREALNNLGLLYKKRREYAKSIDCYKQAISYHPTCGMTWSNLGNSLKECGRVDDAITALKHACTIQEGLSAAFSNYLVALNYCDHTSASDVYEAHCEWHKHCPKHISADRFDLHAAVERGQKRDGKLRLAYVSPDLHRHSVAFFIENVLASHSSQFDITVYDCNTIKDETNQRLRALGHRWVEVAHETDVALADRIYNDEIDILVDLCGHMANNRLAVFYQRPAPVQVTWLGYPNTTGLSQMDYRISDAIADPPKEGAQQYTEKLLRLPQVFLNFRGQPQAPEPCRLRRKHFTFASFNNAVKISETTQEAWIRILQGCPDARLLIKAAQLGDMNFRERLLARFEAAGIAVDRIEFMGLVPDENAHLATYQQVDLALDTFPYNGTTTTCEAAWMGVPTLCLEGATHAARVGVSLMSQLGLTSFICKDIDEYVNTAIGYAVDAHEIDQLRSSLRKRLTSSALGQAKPFTLALEDKLIAAWQARSAALCEPSVNNAPVS